MNEVAGASLIDSTLPEVVGKPAAATVSICLERNVSFISSRRKLSAPNWDFFSVCVRPYTLVVACT